MFSPARLAPWVVGREALLEYAADDYLHELTRQRPWLHARYEELLEQLTAHLEERLQAPAPLKALNADVAQEWLGSLEAEQQEMARDLLADFDTYLVEWGWVERSLLAA
ncbi:hypothetical protein HNR42_001448 [Deinobacterium chartae]|uniref:Uncharacterized protein n=1 Tax=Deinobacterium chartae TaxID=521158 RepID=A0A841I276_9DEIO|nr:hypothetical protein [Deinobacterium chartae]MBB6098025.1 hypothetical protein [Deinobacterium chartae]